MRFFKLFLPGNFEDSFIYMGRLMVLTENRTIRVYSLERMVGVLEEKYPKCKPLPTWFFLRNDWFSTPQFQTLIQNQYVADGIMSAYNNIPQEAVELNGNDFFVAEFSLDMSVLVYLDILFYNRRMYLSADNGFYSVDIEWKSNGETNLGKLNKKLDTKSYSISARYGAVAASCGNNGVFAFTDDFREIESREKHEPIHLMNRSLRTAWLGQDLINYSTPGQIHIYRGELENVFGNHLEEKRFLTNLSSEGENLTEILKNVGGESLVAIDDNYSEEKREVNFVYNDGSKFYIQTKEGEFYDLHINRSNKGVLRARNYHGLKSTQERILTLNNNKEGLIIETYDSVIFLSDSNSESYRIVDKGVLTVRTFPRSQNFRNMIAIVSEDGVLLISVVDDLEVKVSSESGNLFKRWSF